MTPSPRYAELQCVTNFSFLRGASHADELVITAKALGLDALAITDRNTLAGVVRAHTAAQKHDFRIVIGCRLDLEDAPSLLCYPTDRAAYGRLARLLTTGQRRAEKGACRLTLADVRDHAAGQVFVLVPPEQWDRENFIKKIKEISSDLEVPCYLAAQALYRGDDRRRIAGLDAIARVAGLPLVATGDVQYHDPTRRPLQDVLTCIREGCTIDEAGFRLAANAERHLKGPRDMARLFAGFPDALKRTVEIAERCDFSLDALKYNYPDEPVPAGRTPQAHLEALTWDGAHERYPDGIPAKVDAALRKELALIDQLGYAPYFLTVHDIVRWAREQAPPILCQGRGSAANSAVCFCLHITSVDPAEIDLLFERFLSAERNEPPDIDVDFEHERREEVMQYIYRRYGRHRAGIAATVITYRARSAVREVGKVMGLSEDIQSALASTVWGWSSGGIPDEHVREAGLDPHDPTLRRTLALTGELIGFPRHLSQHVGGFVLTQDPLCEVVPIGNAAMDDRTFVEWDKDDLDALGILKIDVLALGMLTCIRKCFELMRRHLGERYELADFFPACDEATYDMLCRADSIGVFQVESRAQMNMLPRLKPRTFYDLVIEVAIVRPGPIQGDMVHPYLRRRDGIEQVDYPSPAPEHGPPDELERILDKTKGVPIFQEQAMRIAIEAAKFTPDEANRLRHAMATFRRRGTIETLEEMMVSRMVARGYDPDFAQRCFDQIKGFGEYGFPESHAASFALLVYVSSWLKCHRPAVFACGLLNAQPMGFYAPAQIVRDAREHGVVARHVDVAASDWDNTLEPCADSTGGLALRLGFRQIKGVSQETAEAIMAARAGTPSPAPPPHPPTAGAVGPSLSREGRGELVPGAESPSPLAGEGFGVRGLSPFASVEDLQARAGVTVAQLEKLAAADVFRSMGLDRRQALWQVKALPRTQTLPLFAAAATREAGEEPAVALPAMPLSEHVVDDYQTLRLSLKAHPVSFLRPWLDREQVVTTAALADMKDGQKVAVAGIVLIRQRPGSAKGVVFMTIEDETGVTNAVVWPNTMQTYRRVVMGSRLVLIRGRIQRHQDIIHLVAGHLEDWSVELLRLSEQGTELETELARADEVKNPGEAPYGPDALTPDTLTAFRPAPADRPGATRPLHHKNKASLRARSRLPRHNSARHPRNVRDLVPRSRDFH